MHLIRVYKVDVALVSLLHAYKSLQRKLVLCSRQSDLSCPTAYTEHLLEQVLWLGSAGQSGHLSSPDISYDLDHAAASIWHVSFILAASSQIISNISTHSRVDLQTFREEVFQAWIEWMFVKSFGHRQSSCLVLHLRLWCQQLQN